jgi:DNA-binding NtrC family response regulator
VHARAPDYRSTQRIDPDSQRIISFRVRVVHGPDDGAACASDGEELTIGTDESCHLRLSDPSVSRHHCALIVTQQGIEMRDLGSTNGTLLAGYQVSTAVLTSGAVIGVGQSLLELEVTNESLARPTSEATSFGAVLGVSPAMRNIFAVLGRVAPSDATVLLEGETGTGKTALAEAIHERSLRASGPFVVIECGAIPPSLIESELFGHERGAFTGANGSRIGMFEAGAGGTVFLDEIGELPVELQPKLLRVLESRRIRRLGGAEVIPTDVRIVAATNVDLRRAVNRGTFRPDLWYRLNTFRLVLPPLRERREDIPMLVSAFYRDVAKDPNSDPPADLVMRLHRGEWPGNARELRSAVERAALTREVPGWYGEWTADRDEDDGALPFRAAKLRATARWEREYLERLIRSHAGNISAAARAARMDRNYLRQRLQHFKIPTAS